MDTFVMSCLVRPQSFVRVKPQ